MYDITNELEYMYDDGVCKRPFNLAPHHSWLKLFLWSHS